VSAIDDNKTTHLSECTVVGVVIFTSH